MTATFQPGTHPDVESLSAFAEQALGVHERSQLLAHLAVCPRCRQIIALAHQPVVEEIQLVAAAVPPRAPSRVSGRPNAWRKPWLVAAAPLAALAASAAFVFFLHHARVERDAELAKNTLPSLTHTESLTAAPPQSDREHPTPPSQAAPESRKLPLATKLEFDRATEARPRAVTQQPSPATPSPSPAAPIPPAATEAVTIATGQPSIETTSPNQTSEIGQSATTQSLAVLKTPPLPASGSATQQLQVSQQQAFQQTNASMQSRQNVSSAILAGALKAKASSPSSLHGSTGAAATNANAPTTLSGAAAVSHAPLAPPAESSAGSAATSITHFGTLDSVTASAGNAALNQSFRLPGGRTSISVASAGRRMLAIDSTGAGFLSLDSGLTWQPIATQWTGRAVLVRIVPNPFAAAAAQPQAPVSGRAAATSIFTFFEILNDKNQIWRSTDGVTWLAK